MAFKLLTVSGNPKTDKSTEYGYLTGILHLSPAKVSGVMDTCKHKTASCETVCLNTAGRGGLGNLATNNVQIARIRKTKLFAHERDTFMMHLLGDIARLERKALKHGLLACARLNGTQDLPWESIKHEGKTIFEWFPHVRFYDYTKYQFRKIEGINNYSTVFSRTEKTDGIAVDKLNRGENVAVVFDQLPEQWQGFKVIDGDIHDLRFLDPRGVVVGLKAKGRAKKDASGFVVRVKQ
jgi:hypothetical protein